MFDLTFDKLFMFVVIGLPGFVAAQVYHLRCPGQKKNWGGAIVEVASYGILNLVVWSPWVLSIHRRTLDQVWWFEYTAAGLLICLVSPTLFSLLWYWSRKTWLHTRFGFDHPLPKS